MEPRITVAGTEPEPGDRRPAPVPQRPILLVAAAGIAIGVLFGVAFGSPAPAPEDETGAATGAVAEPEPVGTAAVPTTTTTSVPRPDRLAVRVPGIVDTIVLVSTALGGESRVSIWEPTDRSSRDRQLPAGEIRSDASGQWLMTVTDGRLSDLRALWVGNAAWMEPVATGVESATWHRRFPGRIAWVESREGAPVLMTATFLPGRPVTMTEVGPVPALAFPVWYGDEGIALETPDGLVLVDPEDGGELTGLRGASFLGGGADGWLVRVEDVGETGGVAPTVMATTPQLVTLAATDIDPDCHAAEFSPGGGMVALRCPHLVEGDWTVEVWALGLVGVERGNLVYSERLSWVSVPTWSPDGRFVLYSVPDQVRPQSLLVFVETTTWAGTVVVHPSRVTSLAMLRS